MARAFIPTFFAIILVTGTILSPALADTYEVTFPPENGSAPESEGDSDVIFSPEPSPDPAWLVCASKVTLDCATEIIDNDFFQIHVEAKCCRQMLRMGKTCNALLIDDMLKEFHAENRSTKVHMRIDHLWNKCVEVLANN